MDDLLVELSKRGVKLSLEGDDFRVVTPPGALTEELRGALRAHKGQIIRFLREQSAAVDEPLQAVEPDPTNRWQPFPLTELQHAYWLGRSRRIEMGDIAAHLYQELDCPALDMDRLNASLRQMIDRHDMLRAVIDGEGTQRILREVPRYEIAVDDQRDSTLQGAEAAVEATRRALSHQVMKTDQWPLFEIRATLLPGARVRLHVSLDALIVDAWSISLLFREWHQLYEQPQIALPALEFSFRDYVLAEQARRGSASYRRAQDYWMARIDTLPSAPDLPLRADAAARRSPRFSRREAELARPRWEALKAAAKARGFTPSGLLLALYAEVLARWSATPHFALNITLGNRQPLHGDVPHLLGDFTSVLVHEVDRRDAGLSFEQFALQVQDRFFADLDHAGFSGVAVAREWARRRGMSLQPVMPVIFTSALMGSEDDKVGDLQYFGQETYSLSQTPQVWLDHHVVEVNGDLYLIWDAVDAVFEDGVLDTMFAAYRSAIERLADGEPLWDVCDVVALPLPMQRRRVECNRTAAACPERPLHAGFVAQALAQPAAPAVFSAARSLTYGELLGEAAAVADWLLANGLQPAQPVAVLMHKGWEQIVAVYGVLLAGGAYMPVDADLPARRRQELLRIGEVAHVLVQPGAEPIAELKVHEVQAGVSAEFGPSHAKSLEITLDRLAYVIFTSGTTGVPKGVMIDHRGAVNTVEHINRMFKVGPQDRVLGVSSLSFDLSVYDIFGLHAAGGALVLPDYARRLDAVHWRELLVRHRVTLWNSAPQLMRMLMEGFHGGERDLASVRTVLLSGDFIPLDLPESIRERYPAAGIVSLGGATEASVWSIYHPIGAVDPSWKSIPYGKPLPNQTTWVLDSALRPTPDHVRGRIHIGGLGLAQGYWNDAEKTASRFITHPRTGERLYDTGDLGRYAPDGNIVILGRDDGQIKIRGHRIELGEIETLLHQHPQVEHAAVVARGSQESRHLVAYVAPASLDTQALRTHLAERLPDYMVPRTIAALERMPLSSNGKVDHRALPEVAEAAEERRDRVLPRDDVERTILEVWSHVIPGIEIGVTDNFFELGGDSLVATQLIRELNDALPLKFEMHELFEHLTIEGLAALYRSRAGSLAEAPVADVADDALWADLRTAKEGVDGLRFGDARATAVNKARAVLVTGATGWIGPHVLSELLSRTPATLYCLTRTQSREQVFDRMRELGIEVDPSWADRVQPVHGDLAVPDLGVDEAQWQRLACEVDAVYHLGAQVSLLSDYAVLRKVNVNPLAALVRLAAEHHTKPLFFISPMVVSRRRFEDRLVVFPEESTRPDPDGLLGPYAQTKWVAEQVLVHAAERGLPVKIFRASRALPSSRNGRSKTRDTYATVLEVARRAGVVPQWPDSCMYGIPVDLLARLLVEASFIDDGYRGVVHVEHRTPQSLETIIAALIGGKPASVPLAQWKARCLEAADGLPDELAALAKVAFTTGSLGTPVENMFTRYPYETQYFESKGLADELTDLTPVSYWCQVGRQAK